MSTSGRSRAGRRPARLLVALVAAAGCAIPGGSGAAGEPDPAARSGPREAGDLVAAVYTAEQAARGQRVFTSVCATCHGRTEFAGPLFALTWMAEPVGHLFEHISTAMPQDRPGSLSAEEYAAVVAYLLELNGRPAGERELPADAELLARIRW